MNKTFPTITLTVGAKDTVVVKMNDKTLEAVTDYTYDAATGKITSPKLVTGPIVITVTPYAKSSDAKLVADNTNPARNCTLSVQEEVTPKTVTVTGQEGKTVTIADLKACLKTNNAGASYKIYDNTTKTEITDGTVSVNYVNMERLLDFAFDCLSELGEPTQKHLVLELMGRNANLLLLDGDGRILDCLRRVDFEMSEQRQVLPGLYYRLPPPMLPDSFLRAVSMEAMSCLVLPEPSGPRMRFTIGHSSFCLL